MGAESGWDFDTRTNTYRPPASPSPHRHVVGDDVTIPSSSITSAMILDGTIVSADIADGTIAAADLTASLPLGTLGSASVTSNQTGIGAEADLTSLTTTVTVGTSRRIRISAVSIFRSDQVDNAVALKIAEGATILQDHSFALPIVSIDQSATTSVILTPSSGSHTYKLRATRYIGTGNCQLTASSTQPAYILVEDIGT